MGVETERQGRVGEGGEGLLLGWGGVTNTPWEQSSPIQPGKHWQEPSMGLHVPLLVQRQISEQARPKRPLAQTAGKKEATTSKQLKGTQ